MYVAFFTEHSYFEVRSCVVVHLFLLAVAVEFHSIPEFDYPLTCWRMLYLYLLFGDYEYSHYIYLHTDFCVNASIQFTWVILRSRTAESDAKVEVKSLSRVWLFSTPWIVAYQAPPSMWFSGKSTGVGCHFLLHRIWRQTLYHLSHQGSLIFSSVQELNTKITASFLPLISVGRWGTSFDKTRQV